MPRDPSPRQITPRSCGDTRNQRTHRPVCSLHCNRANCSQAATKFSCCKSLVSNNPSIRQSINPLPPPTSPSPKLGCGYAALRSWRLCGFIPATDHQRRDFALQPERDEEPRNTKYAKEQDLGNKWRPTRPMNWASSSPFASFAVGTAGFRVNGIALLVSTARPRFAHAHFLDQKFVGRADGVEAEVSA